MASKLFVANTTAQVLQFTYRLPEAKMTIPVEIKPGTQVQVLPSGSREDHEIIVEQNRMYGLTEYNQVSGQQGFVGMCYRFDDPIPRVTLENVFEHNDEALNKRALDQRVAAALYMDQSLSANGQYMPGSLETKIIQVDASGRPIDEGQTIKIEQTAEVQARGKGRRGR